MSKSRDFTKLQEPVILGTYYEGQIAFATWFYDGLQLPGDDLREGYYVGGLKLISRRRGRQRMTRQWLCECQCGGECTISARRLSSGNAVACDRCSQFGTEMIVEGLRQQWPNIERNSRRLVKAGKAGLPWMLAEKLQKEKETNHAN